MAISKASEYISNEPFDTILAPVGGYHDRFFERCGSILMIPQPKEHVAFCVDETEEPVVLRRRYIVSA
jgi:hypothetical protein